jgi:hypothetical protein
MVSKSGYVQEIILCKSKTKTITLCRRNNHLTIAINCQGKSESAWSCNVWYSVVENSYG